MPGGWAVISYPILDGLWDAGFGASFLSPVLNSKVHVVGGAFIDDTQLMQMSVGPDLMGMEMLAWVQAGLDQFAGKICATGGDIHPDKSWWYLLDFMWVDGKWSLSPLDNGNGLDLLMYCPSGELVGLTCLNLSLATKVLGVWLALDGNNSKAVEELWAVSLCWVDRICSNHLCQSDAWVSYLVVV